MNIRKTDPINNNNKVIKMKKPDFKMIAIRESAIIGSCIAAGFGLGRLNIFSSYASKGFFAIKFGAMLYVASIAFRLAWFFIRKAFVVAILLGLVAIILLILAARYPAVFAFLK